MSLFNQSEKAYLMLADGQIFEGRSFGAKGTVIGEVVFTTGMTGYQETLTDPSYCGQIVAQTFPLIGNYGVNDEDNEASEAYVSGYVVREWCNTPSNFRMDKDSDINEYLKNHNVVGIHSIDTRRLTRLIREKGVMNGVITTEDVYSKKAEFLEQINSFSAENTVMKTTVSEAVEITPENPQYTVAVMDFGCKKCFINELLKRNCKVVRMPANTSADQIKAISPDGIFLSNGPGNPAADKQIIENIKAMTELSLPIFGVSFGHQLLALSQGAETEKHSYGHRGANQPVIDLASGKTYVTEQNHGYIVKSESLDDSSYRLTHINANDKTCEGIKYNNINAFSVQFYPAAHGGPLDTSYLFDDFVKSMNSKEAK